MILNNNPIKNMKMITKIIMTGILAVSLNSCATNGNNSDPLGAALQTGTKLLSLKNIGGALTR